MIVGPPETLYEGGFFKATLDFPPDFPNMPPVMRFTSAMWHPNGFIFLQYICSICVKNDKSNVKLFQYTRTAKSAFQFFTIPVKMSIIMKVQKSAGVQF